MISPSPNPNRATITARKTTLTSDCTTSSSPSEIELPRADRISDAISQLATTAMLVITTIDVELTRSFARITRTRFGVAA